MRCITAALLLLGCVCLASAQCDFQPEIQEVTLDSSTVISNTPDNRCLVGPTGEDCVSGTGRRNLVRFTTVIRNVGTEDCIVGTVPVCPAPGIIPPDQGPFHFATCHKHWHLQNYADYYMTAPIANWQAQGLPDQCSSVPHCAVNDTSCRIISGHKTGFCLMDSLCGEGTDADDVNEKFTCSYQGVSAGCMDAYVADLPCQWIDVTSIQAKWQQEMCLCVTVNANLNSQSNNNIAGEINFNNNRMCLPVTIGKLPEFQAQNVSYVSAGDYLTPANQCVGWNDGVNATNTSSTAEKLFVSSSGGVVSDSPTQDPAIALQMMIDGKMLDGIKTNEAAQVFLKREYLRKKYQKTAV